MTLLLLRKKLLRISIFIFILCGSIYLNHDEPWIDSGDLSTIKINMTSDEVIEKLGSPLYIEAINDPDDEIITKNFYYNFRTKKYKTDSPDKTAVISESNMSWGRSTIVQFTFIDDILLGWEEDRLTLNMTTADNNDDSILRYIGLLLNVILTIKVFSM